MNKHINHFITSLIDWFSESKLFLLSFLRLDYFAFLFL
ncbi:hypothetical protein BANRA_03809 [Klebsiella pneumoniae]|nr:hypothetical protein BANRA_01712 [Klebsiella pneumoniae]VCZ69057.1 hypothetical protein BANRA_03809 [Klebsiella pneumoniae]VDA25747.1 hypothetical protein BANRA_04336 [Klebsiella pneumoniae]